MTTLHIALQEGFLNDRVVISLNGGVVADFPSVSTRNQIGFAESVEVDMPPGPAQVEVRLPARGLDSRASVEGLGGTLYVAASIEAGQLRLSQQREPFRYL
jgi:hypothetical protein